MTLHEKALKERTRLSAEIRSLEKQLASLPEGRLSTQQSNGYVKWFQVSDGHRKYIPKNEKTLAEDLAWKAYLNRSLRLRSAELAAVETYLSKMPSPGNIPGTNDLSPVFLELMESGLRRHAGRGSGGGAAARGTLVGGTIDSASPGAAACGTLVGGTVDSASPGAAARGTSLGASPALSLREELERWQNAPYQKSTNHPENLTIRANSHLLVRSKSEAFIVAVLTRHGIPFRYEAAFTLPDVTLFPDFTIRHPDSGEYYLWEHCGLIDKPYYQQQTLWKLSHYVSAGFIPGENLIRTFETDSRPLSPDRIEALVNMYFL